MNYIKDINLRLSGSQNQKSLLLPSVPDWECLYLYFIHAFFPGENKFSCNKNLDR